MIVAVYARSGPAFAGPPLMLSGNADLYCPVTTTCAIGGVEDD